MGTKNPIKPRLLLTRRQNSSDLSLLVTLSRNIESVCAALVWSSGLITQRVNLVFTILLLLTIFVNTGFAAETQSEQSGSRPTIGLALSGGGARGGAHLGVLEILEENRIPVDFIAGTSIGAFVGGLYSSGMSIDEIETASAQMTWNKILEDRSNRTDRSFRRKRDDDLYLIKYRPGFIDGKLKLPRGILQGQRVELELSRQLLPVADIKDFSRLPIHFKAVTSDIGTGEEFVLRDGNLAQSIRASMSIPTVMAPAYIDGRYLVDGGVTNNLPINVVKSMGADIVIAVDIATPISDQNDVDSVLAVTGQLSTFLTQRGSQEQLKLLTSKDVLLKPNVDGIRTADISAFPDAKQAGREAATTELERLKTLSLSTIEYAAYRNRMARPSIPSFLIDKIEVINDSSLNDRYIKSKLVETRVGQPFNVTALERDIARIYGLDLFENVFYELDFQSHITVLRITVRESSWGPTYLQFGAQFNSNGGGENTFNLGTSYLRTLLNSNGGEWRFGFQLGSEWAAFSEIHQPFGKNGKYFISPQIGYQEKIANISSAEDSISSINIDQSFAGLDIGKELGTFGEIRIGLRRSKADVKRRIGNPPVPEQTLNGGEVFLKFSVDEFDSLFFPRDGSQFSVEWLGSRESLGADATFDQLKISAGFARTHNKNTVLANALYSSTIEGEATVDHTFSLGGFGQLSGFRENQFNGQHRALITTSAYRDVSRSPFTPLYAGVSLEHGLVSNDDFHIDLADVISAGAIWIGADTLLGPIYFSHGRGEGGKSAWYLFLGSPF